MEDAPVQSYVITRLDLDPVRRRGISHHVAPQVDRVEILDGRVGIPRRRRAVESGDPDAVECALIDSIHKYALVLMLDATRKIDMWIPTHIKVCAAANPKLDAATVQIAIPESFIVPLGAARCDR